MGRPDRGQLEGPIPPWSAMSGRDVTCALVRETPTHGSCKTSLAVRSASRKAQAWARMVVGCPWRSGYRRQPCAAGRYYVRGEIEWGALLLVTSSRLGRRLTLLTRVLGQGSSTYTVCRARCAHGGNLTPWAAIRRSLRSVSCVAETCKLCLSATFILIIALLQPTGRPSEEIFPPWDSWHATDTHSSTPGRRPK